VTEVARALAQTHVELVLIHPFREGNGRIARALSTLMGLQAGLPPLDFGSITGKATKNYFMAIQRGMDRDYRLMEKLFETIIERSLAAT
jgi:cell filamentation protein